MMKGLILLSGGLESSALVPYVRDNYKCDHLEAVSVFYGQTNSKEKYAAQRIASYYNIPITFIDLSESFSDSACAMISKNNLDVFADETEKEDNERSYGVKEKTFVPYRNGVFISVATVIAYTKQCSYVFCGIHKLNSIQEKLYPDCSRNFIFAQASAVEYGTDKNVKFVAPFIDMEKYEVLAFGLDNGLPYELTWSCYTNEDIPCGKCFACIERGKAFAKNNEVDPLLRLNG